MKLNPITNTKLKKIVSVYQLEFTNKKSPGIGDFLRGTFFLMQLSKILNLEFEIDISNHPISQFVINKGLNPEINYNNIEFKIGMNRPPLEKLLYTLNPPNNMFFEIDFINQIISALNNSNTECFPLFSNAFPMYYNFKDEGRNYLKSQLLPNEMMVKYIDETFDQLKLEKNTYAVLHLRTGDQYLSKNEVIDHDFINKINKHIDKMIVPGKKYLLLSDNNVLKEHLKHRPNFYVLFNKIEHLGGEVNIKGENNTGTKDSDGVKNTMLEFYLMSFSNSIFSISVYDHISGFSKYCAEIFNIPFKNIRIRI
jgi:hypothetical protein